MIVTCEQCSARYKLDDAKVTGAGARITCPRCRHVFVVYRSNQPAPRPTGSPVEAPPAPSLAVASPALAFSEPPPSDLPPADQLDFRAVGIPSWKVKVRIGLVYDFSDLKTLRKYIHDGRVTAEDTISCDGREWTTIGDIPDLDAWFVALYRKAKAEQDSLPPPGAYDDESPTNIVAASSLGRDIARQALEQAASDPPVSSLGPAAGQGMQFVDPFAALKGRQKERIHARRRAASARHEPAGTRGRVPLLVGGIALLCIAGWWALRPAEQQAAVAPVRHPPPAPQSTPAPPSDLRARVAETLSEVDLQPLASADDELGRIPVRPADLPVAAQPQDGGRDPAPAATHTMLPTDQVEVGDDAMRRSDYRTAVKAYAKATAMQPSNPDYHARYGKALYRTGDVNQAYRELRTAEAGGASDPEVLRTLGDILSARGDVAGAAGYYNRYLRGSPRDAAEVRQKLMNLQGS